MYDHLNWEYDLKVILKMRFGVKSVGWICWCISTPSFSMLVNGSPTRFFKSSRGLKQGDLLSPFLFILGMEVLSLLLKKAVEGGFLSSYSFKGRNDVKEVVSYLLFANDTLIFCNDSTDQMVFLSWTLAWFGPF